MIETIVLVMVTGLITVKARQLARNQLLWAAIAVVSYLTPLFFFGHWLLPMVNQLDPYLGVQAQSLDIIGIGFGLAGAWFAYMRLVFIDRATALTE